MSINLEKTNEFFEKEVENKVNMTARHLEVLASKVRSKQDVSDSDIANIINHLSSLHKTASALEAIKIIKEANDSDGDLSDFLNLV